MKVNADGTRMRLPNTRMRPRAYDEALISEVRTRPILYKAGFLVAGTSFAEWEAIWRAITQSISGKSNKVK